jgi:hypothetical protein
MNHSQLKKLFEKVNQADDPYKNPELVDILLNQNYGTAVYLQDLVAHLWNSEWKCNLPNLLSNSDHKHFKFAQAIIENYKAYGENSHSFREVAQKVVENKLKAIAYNKGYELAEEKAENYGSVKVSHQEFLDWKESLPQRITDGDEYVSFNESDKELIAELMEGVERFEDSVTCDEAWLK